MGSHAWSTTVPIIDKECAGANHELTRLPTLGYRPHCTVETSVNRVQIFRFLVSPKEGWFPCIIPITTYISKFGYSTALGWWFITSTVKRYLPTMRPSSAMRPLSRGSGTSNGILATNIAVMHKYVCQYIATFDGSGSMQGQPYLKITLSNIIHTTETVIKDSPWLYRLQKLPDNDGNCPCY